MKPKFVRAVEAYARFKGVEVGCVEQNREGKFVGGRQVAGVRDAKAFIDRLREDELRRRPETGRAATGYP